MPREESGKLALLNLEWVPRHPPRRSRLQPANNLLPVLADLVEKTGLGRRMESSFPDSFSRHFH
jgi:hypothetical protein